MFNYLRDKFFPANTPWTDKYAFSNSWTSNNLEAWKKYLDKFKGQPGLVYLEIGVHEGSSLIWMFENILSEKTSMAYAIDNFHNQTKKIFFDNLKKADLTQSVRVLEGESGRVLRDMVTVQAHIIYVDGSHDPVDVLNDAVLCWSLLLPKGIMIFDDYLLQDDALRVQAKEAIDAFIRIYHGRLKVLYQGYQVIVEKIW